MTKDDDSAHDAGSLVPSEKDAYIESSIQKAMREGAFDNLPGAGKPIPGIDRPLRDGWWIQQKIREEELTGLAPAPFLLKQEYRERHARLDEFSREADAREYLVEFNKRVIDARRQLLGGPPVLTPTCDIEEEVRLWQQRRQSRT